jgi:LPS O-antigen subunit length determinant protein (WzzB/FepE family)
MLVHSWNFSVKTRAAEKVQFLDDQLRRVQDDFTTCDDNMLQVQARQSAKTELMALSRKKAAFQNQLDELYHMKLKAQLEADWTQSRDEDTFKVVDEPNLPEQPIASNRRLILLVGILVGFVPVLIANSFKAPAGKR